MSTKKFLCLLLATCMLLIAPLCFAACGDEASDTSSATSKTSSTASKTESTVSNASGAADSSAATEESSADDTSDTSTEQTPEKPDFISNFVSIGTVDVTVRATSSNAIRLTGVDKEVLVYGDIVLYGNGSDLPEEIPADFSAAVFTYDGVLFGYAKTAYYDDAAAADLSIPDDGFVIIAHASQDTYIERMKKVDDQTTVFPHGLHLYKDGDYEVKRAIKSPTIDGKFSESEWNAYLIDNIDSENEAWSYAQFEKDHYYSTANYYTTYDDQYLYLCVVVSSPYHYCPITPSTAGNMYQYECIQAKVSTVSPDGEYIAEHYDHVIDGKATQEGVVRAYGFAANDSNETCYYESGYTSNFIGKVACSRDDGAQQTVYEVAFAWEEFDITPESGMQLGLTFSINSTNEEDVASGVWKNITYRCGGGVIGRNDWSKIPVITLK